MKMRISALLLALFASTVPLGAQQGASPASKYNYTGPSGTIQGAKFRTQFIWLGESGQGLLYEPTVTGPKARIALVMTQGANSDIFTHPVGREMASRGYRVLMVNYRGANLLEAPLPTISRGIAYARSLPGVQRVVTVGHSGGGNQMLFYANVAEHGPSACNGPEKIYPCRPAGLSGLQKPDGLIVLDTAPAAFHAMSGVDPAVKGKDRDPALDMFSPANGYDPKAKRATYAPEFAKRYYAAQAARNAQIVGQALDRLRAISQGKGEFSDDETLFIRGIGTNGVGPRLYFLDTALLSHTKKPHTLLRADGTEVNIVLQTVRVPVGQDEFFAETFGNPLSTELLGKLGYMNANTTVRNFLASYAIRTTPDYGFTADDIVGVDWHSAYSSPVGNAEGISVPTLVEANSCHYLVVLGEKIYDQLASKDKTYAALEGATHDFEPCKPQYGDTMKHLFDFTDRWLSKEGRF